MLKRLLQQKLAAAARRLIAARRPEIIGISGSVGKTTSKEAIAAVLSARFAVRATYKNYNNEIGLPLTVIGADTPGRSLSGWLAVLRQAKRLAEDKQAAYPEMLVLEMGIDRPGDMDALLAIARPSRAVLTRLGTAHLEFFPSLAALYSEKLKIAQGLLPDGICIYNYEDEALRGAVADLPCQTIGYGFSRQAEVAAENISIRFGAEPGSSFKLVYDGSAVPVFIPGLVSRPGILAALAGAAVGFSYGLNAIEIAGALAQFSVPAGRMRVLSGINQSLIIDDTYNSSPEAAEESLRTLAEIPRDTYAASWAVLGDMRELGAESERAHRSIGARVAELGIDRLVTVGAEAALIAAAARQAGMPAERIMACPEATAAADYLASELAAHDVVLIKGSQAVRLEKVVESLLAEPARAGEWLVRQGAEWK